MRFVALGVAVVAAALAIDALGHASLSADIDGVIKARQANERELGGGYRELRRELAKPKPIGFLVKEYANQISNFAGDQSDWYPEGSGPGSGLPTHAKAEVWTDRATFDGLFKTFQGEAKKLAALADDEDFDGLRTQLKLVAEQCMGCHDKFKEPSPNDTAF